MVLPHVFTHGPYRNCFIFWGRSGTHTPTCVHSFSTPAIGRHLWTLSGTLHYVLTSRWYIGLAKKFVWVFPSWPMEELNELFGQPNTSSLMDRSLPISLLSFPSPHGSCANLTEIQCALLRTTASLHMEYHVPRGSLPLLLCLRNIIQSFELSSLPLWWLSWPPRGV